MSTMWQGCCYVKNEFEQPSVRQHPSGETSNSKAKNDKMTTRVKLRFAKKRMMMMF